MRRRPFGLNRNRQRVRLTPCRLGVEVMESRLLLATFTVLNTADSGAGSLRQAILDANSTPNTGSTPDTIDFAITTGVGDVKTIQPVTPLPAISESVLIDGNTQPGSATTPTPRVELDGTLLTSSGVNGLSIVSLGVTVRGLVINHFSGAGIEISGGASGASVTNTFIGTDASGVSAAPNGVGIQIVGSPKNTIGASGVGLGNLISGNLGVGVSIVGLSSTGNLVQGNLIGTDVNGSNPLGNGSGVVISGDGSTNSGARNNTIGGLGVGDGNTISGNADGTGVVIQGTGANANLVQGNRIGTNSFGTAPLGNLQGVQILAGASNNTIGGTVAAALDLISGNASAGIIIDASSSNTVQGNNIGTNLAGTAPLVVGSPMTTKGIVLDNGAAGNIIGGTATGSRNLISGLAGNGVWIHGRQGSTGPVSTGNTVQGNLIGINGAGLAAVANLGGGIVINDGAIDNTIGGTATGARNVISGNTNHGVLIQDAETTGNLIQGNNIGTDINNINAIPNGMDGVAIALGASNNTVGGITANTGNTIAFNLQDGVAVLSGTGNAIRHNAIFNNQGQGIVLGPGANHDQAAPVLTSAITANGVTTISGTLHSTPNATFDIDVFSSNPGDSTARGAGRVYLDTKTNVTTDANGDASFSFTTTNPAVIGNLITATATNTNASNTSEFSGAVLNVHPSADVGVSLAAAPQPVIGGNLLTYTAIVSNAGSATATNVTLTNILPSGLTFANVSATQGTVNQASGTITAALGSLTPGSTATVTITAFAAAPTGTTPSSITNTVTVLAAETDPNLLNNTASVTSTVLPSADLQVTAIGVPDPTIPGGPVSFTFTVTNNGPAAASGILLSSALPANATFVSVSQSQGTVSGNGVQINFALGDLASGASATATVILQPTSIGVLIASASITHSDQADSYPANNTGSAAINVNAPLVETTAPTVVSLSRTGFHRQTTRFTPTFSQPLNPTTAQAPANYSLWSPGRDGLFGTRDVVRIPLRLPIYDAIAQSVTLVPRSRTIPLRTFLRPSVKSTAPGGITNTAGLLLDGNRDGQPEGDYVALFQGFGSGPNGPQGETHPPSALPLGPFVPLDTRALNHVERLKPPFGKSQRTRP